MTEESKGMTEETKRVIRIIATIVAILIGLAGLFVVAMFIFVAMAMNSYGSNK
jgi:flagellar basal body-associated protein FliL